MLYSSVCHRSSISFLPSFLCFLSSFLSYLSFFSRLFFLLVSFFAVASLIRYCTLKARVIVTGNQYSWPMSLLWPVDIIFLVLCFVFCVLGGSIIVIVVIIIITRTITIIITIVMVTRYLLFDWERCLKQRGGEKMSDD